LDRKYQIAKSGLYPWLRDFLKANTLGFVFGAVIVEIAFASNKLVPSFGWILAGILSSFLFMLEAVAQLNFDPMESTT
jgi:uncharacterized membrane protein YesL